MTMTESLHFEEHGQGQSIVMIHGWGFNGGVWDALAQRLAGDFRVIRPDLPGHGRSAFSEDGFQLDTLVDAISGRVGGPAIWIGWSLGALLALKAAIRRPHQVQGLISIAGTPSFTTRRGWHHGVQPEVLERFGADLCDDWKLALRRFLALQAKGSDLALVHRVRALMSAQMPTPEGLRAGLKLLRSTDLRYEVHQIECPVMAIHGVEDTLVPLAGTNAWTAQLADARLLAFKDGGHMPFLSYPREVESAIRGFADYGPVFRNWIDLDSRLAGH